MQKIIFILLNILILPLFAAPTTLTYEEKQYIESVEDIRKKGFRDRQVDRSHDAISMYLQRIKFFVDKGYYQNNKRFSNHLQQDLHEFFFKDEAGKLYYKIDLKKGETFNDYPDLYLFDTVAFIYPTDDGKGLSKVILHFKKVNFTGDIYIRELRRIVNPTPNVPGSMKQEGIKVNGMQKIQQERTTDVAIDADNNSDITLEYFSQHDKMMVYPNTPDIKIKPSLVSVLNDPNDLLAFEIQKGLMDSYRKVLNAVEREMQHQVHVIELDKRNTEYKLINVTQ